MLWRLLLLCGGVVLMINGCNGLISGQFGTHKLRTLTAQEAAKGVGDADYMEISGAVIGEPYLIGKAMRQGQDDYLLRPLFTPVQQQQHDAGETVTVSLIVWQEVAPGTGSELRPTPTVVRGMISKPTDRKNPIEKWQAQGIELAEPITYLQIGEQPLAWYWNLALFLGGILLAVGTEAFAQRRRNKPSSNED